MMTFLTELGHLLDLSPVAGHGAVLAVLLLTVVCPPHSMRGVHLMLLLGFYRAHY